eukprot:Hpha_TRINITY_DN8047_c0_g1::TRINITY_DN8047_c0_g1_i1::g.140215::m.140215
MRDTRSGSTSSSATAPPCPPVHDYGGSVSKLIKRVNGLKERYGRDVWLTEFAISPWTSGIRPTRAEQDAYMKEVLPALDQNPNVFRYAWYSARDAPPPAAQNWTNGALLEYNVTLPTPTSTGLIYKANAVKQPQ